MTDRTRAPARFHVPRERFWTALLGPPFLLTVGLALVPPQPFFALIPGVAAPFYLLLGGPMFYRTLRRAQPEFGRLIMAALTANLASPVIAIVILLALEGLDGTVSEWRMFGAMAVFSFFVAGVLGTLFAVFYGTAPQPREDDGLIDAFKAPDDQ